MIESWPASCCFYSMTHHHFTLQIHNDDTGWLTTVQAMRRSTIEPVQLTNPTPEISHFGHNVHYLLGRLAYSEYWLIVCRQSKLWIENQHMHFMETTCRHWWVTTFGRYRYPSPFQFSATYMYLPYWLINAAFLVGKPKWLMEKSKFGIMKWVDSFFKYNIL